MITAAGRGFVGIVAVTLLLAAGCSEDSQQGSGSEPIRAPGTVTAPRRPIIVQPVPDGWSVSRVEQPTYVMGRREMQTLYLPPGSTSEKGPAIAVGHFGSESGFTLCGRGRETDVVLRGANPAPGRLLRLGALSTIEGEVSTDDLGYVFGRDVTDEQLMTAARAAQFPEGGIAEVAVKGLPDSFRRFVSAPVIPNGVFGQIIELRSADGNHYARISAYDGDAASDALASFWRATVVKEPCHDFGDGWKAQTTVDDTHVYVSSFSSESIVDQLAGRLGATDQSGFEAFRARVGDIPAATLLGGCGGAGGVIVDGTEGRVRWALGMSTGGAPGSSCTAYVIDGQARPGLSTGLAPAPSGKGSYAIDVLANSNSAGDAPAPLHVIGGTVPASASRVVIADGTGATANAVIVKGGSDPSRRYFGGLLYPSAASSAGLSASVVAYDTDGKEVGRYASLPG